MSEERPMDCVDEVLYSGLVVLDAWRDPVIERLRRALRRADRLPLDVAVEAGSIIASFDAWHASTFADGPQMGDYVHPGDDYEPGVFEVVAAVETRRALVARAARILAFVATHNTAPPDQKADVGEWRSRPERRRVAVLTAPGAPPAGESIAA